MSGSDPPGVLAKPEQRLPGVIARVRQDGYMRSDSNALEYAKRAGIEVVPAILGLLGPPGAIAGAFLRPGLERLLLRGQDDSVKRVNMLMDYVSEQAGMTPEEFVDWAEARDERRLLAQSAFAAAYNTYSDQKIVALARALTESVRDDANLELSSLVVPAIAALETPHLRVLAAISELPPPRWEGSRNVGRWDEVALCERFPGLAKAMDAILVVLRSGGLVGSGSRPDVSHGLIMLLPTPFGVEVLGYLRKVASVDHHQR